MTTRSIERVRPVAGIVRDRTTWGAYLLLGLFAFLETLLGPAMPLLRRDLDLGYTLASLHFTAFAAGGISAGSTADRLLRRWDRRALLWGGLGGMVVGAAMFATIPRVLGTITGVYLMGVCGTTFLVINQAALADLHGEQRTIALAESNVAASAAAVCAPLAVGLADSTGWGWHWGVLLTVPIFAVLLSTFRDLTLPRPTPQETRTTAAALPRIYWLLWAVMFLAVSVEWCVAYWGADFLDEVRGLSSSTAATAMSIFFAAMVLGRFAGAQLAHRYPAIRLLIAALVVALAGLPVFWLAPNPAISLAGLFVAGFGIANFYPLIIANATTVVPDLADLATARLAISGSTALLLAPFLIGVFSDAVGIRWGFGVVIPFAIIGLAVAMFVRRSLSPVDSETPAI